MMPQAHRLALDLEVPPVLQDLATQRTIGRDRMRSIVHRTGVHEIAGRSQLGNQSFEGLADPPQRRDALFVQLPGDAIVRF